MLENWAEDLATATGKHVSRQNIRNRLHENVCKRKNPLTMNEARTRLSISGIKQLFSGGPKYVWRNPKTELDPKNVTPTVKHGRGHALV